MSDFLSTLPVFLTFTLIAAWFIRRFGGEDRSLLWLSFIAHQAAGIVNILITQYHYEVGDMISYYRFGVVAADRLRSDSFGLAPSLFRLILQQPEPIPIPMGTMLGSTGSMQGISAFMMFVFNDSLFAVCSFISGAAFLSKLALYSVAQAELRDVSRRLLLWACMLVPSAVFWSCALLKEPIAMIGLLASVYACHLIIVREQRVLGALLAVLAMPLIIFTKGYLLPVLALAAGVWYLLHAMSRRRGELVVKVGHVLLAVGIVAAVVLATGAILPRFSVDAVDDELARLQVVGGSLTTGHTNYTLGRSAGEATNQIVLAPLGLLTALFRPLLIEVTTPLVLVSALEMTFFTIWSAMVPFRRGFLRTLTEVLERPFLAFCVTFVVVFGTCAGLGSTNLGTLSRYRMPLMPFFAMALATLVARRVGAESSRSAVAHPPLPTRDWTDARRQPS